jgi:helicase
MALIVREWTRTGNAEHLADVFNCYAFEIDKLRESLDRLLLALSAVQPKPNAQVAEDQEMPDTISIQEKIHALQMMVSTGLDECAVTLTLVPGIGPGTARRLIDNGIEDIEDLSLVDANELPRIRGVSQDRMGKWIDSASEIINSRSAYSYRESAPTADIVSADWPTGIDPYRLRRALDLKVASDDGFYRVSGGLEPHTVKHANGVLHCDCPDAAKGKICKHVLAVRLHQKDRQVKKLARLLKESTGQDALDLFRLWFGGHAPARGGNYHVR